MENIDKFQLSPDVRFLLLDNKLESIESHMNWNIGMLTLAITFIMAIFAVIQFIYQRQIEKESLRKLKEDLTSEINEKILEKEEILKNLINSGIKITESELKNRIKLMSGDLARNYGIYCDSRNFHATSFGWWLTAATEYSELGNNSNMYNISFNAAKESLEKVNTKEDVNVLLEDINRNSDHLNRLKIKNNAQAEILESILNEKLRLNINS